MSIKSIPFGGDLNQRVALNPQEFSASQIAQLVQQGKVSSIVGVSAINFLNDMQKRMQMAQTMQQPPVAQQPPIAQQVMQEAAQMGGGVEQLPTNLPQEYASGGIVAFDDGGEVERYQDRGLVRSQHEDLIRRKAEELGVDPDLMVRMAGVESSYNANAVSPKGAAGLMQLMPGTARDLGLTEQDRFNPEKAIPAGISYYKQQLERFGDPRKALAAYNMGPNALTRHLEQNQGRMIPTGLPKETADYITKFFPIGTAQASDTVPMVQVASAPSGVAGLVSPDVRPSISGEQPVVEPGYGDVVRGGLSAPTSESTTPFGRGIRSLVSGVRENQENARLQQELASRYGMKASPIGLFMDQSDVERQAGKELLGSIRDMNTPELRTALSAPNAVEALKMVRASRIPDQPERRRQSIMAAEARGEPAAPKETKVAEAAATKDSDIAPAPVDILSMVQDAPQQIQNALGDMIAKRKAELDKMDEPSIALLEKRQAERGKEMETRKNKIQENAALAFLTGVAGKRGHWSEAIGAGAERAMKVYLDSQAAQQAAQDKFDEATDNLELRKLALKKGNQKDADAYGEKYASLMLQGTKLQADAAYHYNANQIASFDADTKRQALTLGRDKMQATLLAAEAGNIKAKTGLMIAGTKALQQWETSSEKRSMEAAITEKYGKDWMKLPPQSKKRLEAEDEMNQAKRTWVENNMALHAAMGTFGGGGSNIPSFDALMSGI